MNRVVSWLSISIVAVLPFHTLAQEKVTIEPVQLWTNIAAESKVEFQWLVKAPKGFKGRVEWTFADVSKRVLPQGRGETALAGDLGKGVTIKTAHQAPPLADDVILQAELSLAVFATGKDKPDETFQKTLWIFPSDPFFNRAKWLEDLKITLFDPDPKGKTAAALKASKIPHEEMRNVVALAEFKDGVLLVGEGVSFKEEAGLAEALVQAAARGIPVLCLAPLEGTMPLPGADNGLPDPGVVSLQRRDILTILDKRFDAHTWGPSVPVFTRGMCIKADEGKVVGDFAAGMAAWPWMQVDYPDKKGRLIVCCFSLVEHWNTSPTPRFVFARVLDRLTEPSTEKVAAKQKD